MTNDTKAATDEPDTDYAYAVRLATSLREQHYPEMPQWRPLESLYGVLSQIDNMTTGLVRAATPAATAERELFEATATARQWAYRDKDGIWFYPGHSGHDMWLAWQAARAQLAAPPVAWHHTARFANGAHCTAVTTSEEDPWVETHEGHAVHSRPLVYASAPASQAPKGAETWTRAMNAALAYRNADPDALDEQDAWADLVHALNALADPVAEAQAEPYPNLAERLQLKCSAWNTYWRASDAHGVILSREQAVELLQDAIGVEVEIAAEAGRDVLTFAREALKQMIACHDEETCPAIDVARDAIARIDAALAGTPGAQGEQQ